MQQNLRSLAYELYTHSESDKQSSTRVQNPPSNIRNFEGRSVRTGSPEHRPKGPRKTGPVSPRLPHGYNRQGTSPKTREVYKPASAGRSTQTSNDVFAVDVAPGLNTLRAPSGLKHPPPEKPPPVDTSRPSSSHTDDVASISSGRTTSDLSASSRSKCHMCKKGPTMPADQLIFCTTCPRRYHRYCHPKQLLPQPGRSFILSRPSVLRRC